MIGCIRHDWTFGAAGVSSNSEKGPGILMRRHLRLRDVARCLQKDCMIARYLFCDKNTIIIIIIIGALGLVTRNLRTNLQKINFEMGIKPIQKACLLGTARILRNVLDC